MSRPMPEQELREVIARAMYEADLDYYCESDKPPFAELPYWKRDSYLDRAPHIIAALVARVPDGIPAAVERYGNARGALEAARAVPETVDFEFAEVEQEAAASARDLLALVAVARPGVTITDEVVLGAVQRINSRGVLNPHVSWVVTPAEMRPVLEWFAALTPEATDEH